MTLIQMNGDSHMHVDHVCPQWWPHGGPLPWRTLDCKTKCTTGYIKMFSYKLWWI